MTPPLPLRVVGGGPHWGGRVAATAALGGRGGIRVGERGRWRKKRGGGKEGGDNDVVIEWRGEGGRKRRGKKKGEEGNREGKRKRKQMKRESDGGRRVC